MGSEVPSLPLTLKFFFLHCISELTNKTKENDVNIETSQNKHVFSKNRGLNIQKHKASTENMSPKGIFSFYLKIAPENSITNQALHINFHNHIN